MLRSGIACLVLLVCPVGAETGIGNTAGLVVSEKVYRTLVQAEEQIAQETHREAIEFLDRALGKHFLNDQERVLLERLAGVAETAAGDYTAVTQRLDRVIRSGLPDGVLARAKYQLAQLYLHQARHDDALALLGAWVDEGAQSSAEICFLIAAAYAGLEQLTPALEWSERGIRQAATPSEHQYAFVASLNLALERYTRAAELLERLVETHPRIAQYWRQLLAAYGGLGRDERTLAIAELGYLQGILASDEDAIRLAKLYLHHGLPYKAAALLESRLQAGAGGFGGAHYRLLADAWISAREYARAVAPLGLVEELLRVAGNPEGEAEARLRKGVVHARLNQRGKAEYEFEYCLKFEQTRAAAGEWLAYMRVDE